MTEIKQYDVFNFNIPNRGSNHCWDGRLVACVASDGSLFLADTYWSSKYDKFQSGGDRRWFRPDEAVKMGELRFICNLEDVEEIKEAETYYYDESDIFNLSYQHSCYSFYVKKKGAVKSQSRMIEYAKYKLEEALYKKRSAEQAIIRLENIIQKIEGGDTTQYIY